MTKPISNQFKSFFIILFACSAIPAFAQHGGGHGGGGGFHGGSGFHGGGGGVRGGSYAAPSAGYRGSRGGVTSAPRSGGEFTSRAGNSYSRPGNSYAGEAQRGVNSSSSRAAVADGRWHSFAGSNESRESSGARSEAEASNNFHVFSGNRGTASAGTVRSFSGQGGEVWENGPATRNMVPKSQSLSTLHNSFVGSRAATSGLRPNATLSASSRFAAGSAVVGSRGISGGLNAASSFRAPIGSSRFGIPFGRGGCWNCGFGGWGNRWGYGAGWGFGNPWLGFWGWNPFFYGPWWGGPAVGFGYYGYYPNSYLYGYPATGYYAPDDGSTGPAQPDNSDDQDYQGNSNDPVNGNWVTPNGPNPSSAVNSANLAVPVLIYLKGGAVYTVRDYWIVDNELHYLSMDGVQNFVDLDRVDLPRTNSENAKSGVKFIFKSEPSVVPGTLAPAPARAQELNAVPQPEART